MKIKINDDTVLWTIRHGPKDGYSKSLADDEWQTADGALWSHIENMAERGLLTIENNIAKSK